MKNNKLIFSIAACLGMGLLILDSRTALQGAQDGIALALNVLIPSLFPFLFLSLVLTSSSQEFRLQFLKPVSNLFHMPEGTETLLVSALLGGYPAGAQAVCQAYRSGILSRENSEKMLAFCNNAGPSFLFGMVSACFPEKWIVWMLWLFHILGALVAARIFPCTLEARKADNCITHLSITVLMKRSLSVMAVICGWVILFRVIITFADRWFLWLLPVQFRAVFIGFLELSNGICELRTIADERIRFLICSSILSLGGLCICLQTYSVTEGLNKRYYYRGKIIQLLVSCCCSAAFVYHTYFLVPLTLIPLFLFKIRSRNPVTVGV